MATYNFADVVGSTIAFDPTLDILNFAAGSANRLLLSPDGLDIVVSLDGQGVRLANVAFVQLLSSNFAFASGDIVSLGTAGNDSLTGSGGNDFIDIHLGGVDSVAAGDGDDRIVALGSLTATDRVDGGPGAHDELRLQGTVGTVVFTPTTVTGVEIIVFEVVQAPASSLRMPLSRRPLDRH
ncbi:MAG: hypothetical protein U1E62_22495 [Alsobacter sp.]